MSEIHPMRSDQVFVLFLIILIPMTGCFESVVDDAEAQQENSDENVLTSDTIISMPSVVTISIEGGQTETITLNGTTMLLETVHKMDYQGYWRTNQGTVEMSMSCENGFTMDRFWLDGGNNEYLPNLPNIECEIILNSQPANSEEPQTATILTFSEAVLHELD